MGKMLKEETTHFTLSVLAGVLIYLFTGQLWAVPAALLSGFFIDSDHLFDYLIFKKFRNLSVKEFFTGSFFDESGKVILPLHGYEYALILIILGLFIHPFTWLLLTLGLSLLLHLIYDTISNKPIWPTYSILFRLYHHFNHDAFDFKKGKS